MVGKLYEAFNAGDLRALDALLADVFVEHEDTPGIPPTKEGLKQFIGMTRRAFPDALFEVADIAAEGNRVWARVVVTGTQRGEYFGIPPPVNRFASKYSTFAEPPAYQIVEHWGLSDQMGLMRQLGVLPRLAAKRDDSRSIARQREHVDRVAAILRQRELRGSREPARADQPFAVDHGDVLLARDRVGHRARLDRRAERLGLP